MEDRETIEQLNAEAQDHFEEWAIETQDSLEINGPRFSVVHQSNDIWF